MDYATPQHEGSQQLVTLRGGRKIKAGDNKPGTYTDDNELKSIFGYKKRLCNTKSRCI